MKRGTNTYGQKPIEYFWRKTGFTPTPKQKEAILHVSGPLFLTAGPGSGKTRVLLWRAVNLIVYNNIKPSEIFLSTFTEKAALQLKEGLKSLLALVSNENGKAYDLSEMSLGTVHSICQSILKDRRFSESLERKHPPVIIDELAQYFYLYKRSFWKEIIKAADMEDEEVAQRTINTFLADSDSSSRHRAVQNCISLFNRFSEENFSPIEGNIDLNLNTLIRMYKFYLDSLKPSEKNQVADLSLLQQYAFNTIHKYPVAKKIFKHVIIDEYQDTNPIQEKIFFSLAAGHKNICVVGDDDQALYRFRGATVENLVDFPKRCKRYIGIEPRRIDLVTNFRSKQEIVKLYTSFITKINWERGKGKGYYRINDKKIVAKSNDKDVSVLVSEKSKAENVYLEIAGFIRKLKETKKISDYNQVAMIFPAMRTTFTQSGINTRVQGFMNAFNKIGIPYYAPRAGRFLDTEESVAIFGLFLKVFGRPHYDSPSGGLRNFMFWMFRCEGEAAKIIRTDSQLNDYVNDRSNELKIVKNDYIFLINYINRKKINPASGCDAKLSQDLSKVTGISQKAVKALSSYFFLNILNQRYKSGNPFTVEYVINRATSVDWSVLDLFYQLLGFSHFREMINRAEDGSDEAPVCNLGLISQYLGRFLDDHPTVITARFLSDDKFINTFFTSYLYALYRLQETEFEDAEDPFPKGRVPFITIHLAKGLEFPIVVLGSIFKEAKPPSKVETIIRDLIPDKDGETLDKISTFDNMRMFYVALSRAKKLLVLPRYTYGRAANEEFTKLFEENNFTEIKDFNLKKFPAHDEEKEDLGKTYSYTGDYLSYLKCPRNYMFFKKYGFVPSRSQTMFFGSLVHQTIEDLHYYLINQKQTATR